MQIKQQMLAAYLQKQLTPVYILLGQESFLIDKSKDLIRNAINTSFQCEITHLSIENTNDWMKVIEEANSYSLFNEHKILIISSDKKNIDATGKKILQNYLLSINTHCFLIFVMPQVTLKNLSWIANHDSVLISVAYPLDSNNLKRWISQELLQRNLKSNPEIVDLIYQYTQGNMHACAQTIEKLYLCYPDSSNINIEEIKSHLFDQCEYNLYELAETCLKGDAAKAIKILRYCLLSKTEPTFILWILTQEIRNLLQLHSLIKTNIPFSKACTTLKIWPQKIPLYQIAINRCNSEYLLKLHQSSYKIDEQIKTGSNKNVWIALEDLVLNFANGKT